MPYSALTLKPSLIRALVNSSRKECWDDYEASSRSRCLYQRARVGREGLPSVSTLRKEQGHERHRFSDSFVVQNEENEPTSESLQSVTRRISPASPASFKHDGRGGRRKQIQRFGLAFLGMAMFPSWIENALAEPVQPAVIDYSKQPTKSFDADDARLREAVTTFQKALEASSVEEEERLWTEIIEKYGAIDADWVPDIVGRALGNRGNARSRQGSMEQALGDYNRSIQLAPYSVDPVLNRGVALESLGRFQEAAEDYRTVLQASPSDPAAWNNLGNVMAAQGEWNDALDDYRKASKLAPEFSFAAANCALALYQLGRESDAIRQFRTLLRRYPEFPDMRAALAVSLYAAGLTADAENNWNRVEDARYRDRTWVRSTRRWPPRLVSALEGFLDVKPN